MLKNVIKLRKADLEFKEQLLNYQIRNKDFLKPYNPLYKESFYTLKNQEDILAQNILDYKNGNNYVFYIFLEKENLLIGKISLSNIVRGVFQSCFLGYSLDKDYLNNGYMSFAISSIVKFAFDDLKLHRIEANVMPRNKASLRVLEKNNFINEGLSTKYLQINGIWEDHIHMVILNNNY